ncbi:tetratricopeptide repeat protein [Chamaesiphon sp. VAR_48_metabat_135_sub]|uniref:tetratricopeptide repeat protein n=1 Tax=Chamaesiphon sp. VAR_48_metabat_135_sub TaxID=2964699 RepID=UPI00286AB220|nr:tetratricopeptide repeat protein [Chamaesiphon sp. VAR_48_metabat_135_sub]
MNIEQEIPTNLLQSIGKTIVLEANDGQARRSAIETWLQSAKVDGADTWLLRTDRDRDGLWAGLQDLLIELLPQIQSQAPDLIIQHDYELVRILPTFRHTISVRHSSLTDIADESEQIRNYPADRAFRIIQGIIDLLIDWFDRSVSSHWIIAWDAYDQSGALVRLFVRELVRRAGNRLNLTVLIAISPEAPTDVVNKFDPQYLGEYIYLNLPFNLTPDSCQQEMSDLVKQLESKIENNPIDRETYLPQLIHYLRSGNSPELAFRYQVKLAALYVRKGYYEDALAISQAALEQQEIYYPTEQKQRWYIQSMLCVCYMSLDKPLQAQVVVETSLQETDRSDLIFRNCFMIAMLYTRKLPVLDLVMGEVYLERGLAAIEFANLPIDEKVFHQTANRNGLALIRSRQGKYQEAIELCEWCLVQMNNVYSAEKHRLYRSVLLFNIAQVYNSINDFDRAIHFLSLTIELDPNYSEYWNMRGNWYFSIGNIPQALTNYLQAIELSAPYPEVWANVGHCYRHLGETVQAVAAYSRSLDLEPQQFAIFVARAQAFETLGEFDPALADYHTALMIDPQQPLVLANRAILFYELGYLSAAIQDLDRAIVMAPDNVDLHQNRSIAVAAMEHL